MTNLSLTALLFFGGVIVVAVAGIAAGIAAFVLPAQKKKLKRRLDAEYGKGDPPDSNAK